MKTIICFFAILFAATRLFGQGNYFDTIFYSPALDKEKMVRVYLPPSYAENHELHYPVIYFLHGWGGNHTSSSGVLPIFDSLVRTGKINPMLMVIADNSCEPFNGSHYVNSILWGNYEDFMTTDLIAWVDSSFRTIPERNGRALMGQSMGAYGSFRYGILHKDKYSALAAHAGAVDFLDPVFGDSLNTNVLKENQPGPPYFYDYENTGFWTRMAFLGWGAFAPNFNSPRKYINPPIVEFPYDENGLPVDTLMPIARKNSINYLIQQLSPADSVGVFFGCGSQDKIMFYPMNVNLKSTLDNLGLSYEFYDHDGGHSMPLGFMERGLIFLDSLMLKPRKFVKKD
jgi:enterochelin esterase-like enzyme